MGFPLPTNFLLAVVLVAEVSLVLSHGGHHYHDDYHHHHDHHDEYHHHHDDQVVDPIESAKFRYSREANEPIHSRAFDHDRAGHHSRDRDHRGGPEPATPFEGIDRTWLLSQAVLATALISVAPFLILFFIPLDSTDSNQPLLKILLSFAAGGLLGDAFLHLIPHAILQQGGDHDHSHDHFHDHLGHGHGGHEHGHSHDLSVGMWVLAGIVAFLLVEKFVRIVKGGHHHHHHAHNDVSEKSSKTDASVSESSGMVTDAVANRENAGTETETVTRKRIPAKTADESSPGPSTSAATKTCSSHGAITPGNIKVAAYLNLAADFAHNFTDGLAIGASFLRGNAVGYLTTISILFHEVPHEIGDFAILVQSGCGKRKAIALQLVTALGALSGTMTAFLAEGCGEKATVWILPFTAGGFIYIATVSVLPELLEGVTDLKQSIFEVLALLLGVFMMVVIAQYE